MYVKGKICLFAVFFSTGVVYDGTSRENNDVIVKCVGPSRGGRRRPGRCRMLPEGEPNVVGGGGPCSRRGGGEGAGAAELRGVGAHQLRSAGQE